MSYSKNPWWVYHRSIAQAPIRFFCFHYAGGSASAFRQWKDNLHGGVELIAAQLPGREQRYSENLFLNIEPLIEDLVQALSPLMDKEYIVFGHSLGAIVGYELIRALKKYGYHEPLLFIPSGRGAPQLPGEDTLLYELPDKDFRDALREKYPETLSQIFDSPELAQFFLPIIRADFQISETHRYKPGGKLSAPILAFAGEAEASITENQLEGWSSLTTGAFSAQRFPGDHFFIRSAEEQVLNVINRKISELI